MTDYKWIAFGSSPSRIELFGKTTKNGRDPQDEIDELVTVNAIRLVNFEGVSIEDEAVINQIDFDELALFHPIVVGDNQQVKSLTSSPMTLEGFEGSDQRFMDILDIGGWKLVLEQVGDEVSFKWYLLSDWNIKAHPDYFPGNTRGEITISGRTGGTDEVPLDIQIPWPLSVDGYLNLANPKRDLDRWRAPVDPRKILTLFDGAGALLKDFPLGSLDFSSIRATLEDFIDEYEDLVTLETGVDEYGRIVFDIRISPPEEIDIAEFGGLKLSLIGDAAIILSSVFETDYIEVSLRLFLSNQAELKLHGPLVRKVQGAIDQGKEILAMIPVEGGIHTPELPDLQISFSIGDGPIDKTLVSARLPLNWDFVPGLNPLRNIFAGLPMTIDPSKLVGFKFGSLEGSVPKVEMKITGAGFYHEGAVYGISLEIELAIQVESAQPLRIMADWLLTFDTASMSFNPAARLNVRPGFKDFKIGGLRVTGLDTLTASFEQGSLSLQATKLSAFYEGISEPGEPGFELELSNLLIDSGGIDMELFLKGGVTKVSGIGESFKGAEGKIVFKRSKFQSGYIKAEGPLPWMDNATGTITLAFKEGFELDRVQANFQLGLHHKSDWWLELNLQSVNIDIHVVDGRPSLILMVTGKIGIVPPADSGSFLLSYLKSASLEFKDLVLTKAFDHLPPGISLSVVLAKPVTVDLLGVFGFEMRSIAIGTGFDSGQAAITVGGQVFFSSNDLQNKDPEFHKFKIGNPKPNDLIPRIALDKLGLDFSNKPSVAISGSVDYKDTNEWKGFKGHGQLTINKTIKINVLLEFAMVLRPSDQQKVRVWMVYAEWLDLNIKFIDKFYLRDLGVGFGMRKTLHVMDEPTMILSNPSRPTMTIGPHLPTSWKDDLEGDSPNWTLVFSSWITYGLESRTKPTPLVGDILFGLRSDLTILISMRGWIFGVLDDLRKGSGGLRPSIIGLMYYSAKNNHLLATYVVDPSASTPKGVPPAVVKALIKSPFSFVLETKPGMFRLELGWPRQLTFPLGVYTGRAGFLMRTTPTSITIGVGFEISIDHKYDFGFSIGIGSVSIRIEIYIGVYGMILARIGNRPALYGIVGINAIISIGIWLSVDFKIFWVHIKFSFGVEISIVISARVDFGISDAGFGIEGYASASLRIWKFSFGATVSFAINKSALYDARDRVLEDVTMAGTSTPTTLRPLPQPTFALPAIKVQVPKWRAMPVRKGDFVYVLLIPEEDTWFACPASNEDGKYAESGQPAYELSFELMNAELEDGPTFAQVTKSGSNRDISVTIPWNREVSMMSPGEAGEAQKFPVGNLYYEPRTVQVEHQLIDQLLEDPSLQPELLTDWRTRTEEGARDGMDDDMEVRPDVRSPKFSADGSLYDLALEEAFKYGETDLFSWQSLTVAQTRWEEEVINKPEVLEYMMGQGYTLPPDSADALLAYKRRKTLLNGMEDFRRVRGGLSGTLLRQYKLLLNSNTPLDQLEVLAASGLFFKFRITDKNSFSMKANSLKIDTGYGNSQEVPGDQIEDGTLNQDTDDICFDSSYRIRDLLEFQDKEGIHFSWQLESTTNTGEIQLMTENESSGLREQSQDFEYFDHYLVERTNLSTESHETGYTRREAKPGFVPALVDMGDGNRNFYLVVPRFDFSDMFQVPAAVGDQLLYRFTAVDIFGNHSQTLEYFTTKKHLDPPPPPDRTVCDYFIELAGTTITSEKLVIAVSESKEMANWQGSNVTYQVWTRSQSLASGGYFGLGDDVEESGNLDDNPVVSPKGMRLVAIVDKPREPLVLTSLSGFGYGQVFTLFIRSISSEGNASRLIRCQHSTSINKNPGKPQAYLERIPPASYMSVEWLTPTELRGEVLPCLEPALITDAHEFIHVVANMEGLREVSIKLLHNNYLGGSFLYPTGGYEVFVRDRDASVDDDFANYRKQVTIEVLSPSVYGKTPYNTSDFSKWASRFRMGGGTAGYPHWGEPLGLAETKRIKGLADGLLLHARLEGLFFSIQSWASESNAFVVFHGGGVTRKDIGQISFDDLADKFNAEVDPHGMGLLACMGRTIDFAIYRNGGLMRDSDLFELITGFFYEGSDYRLTLELLLNSDKRTPMNYYRLGLHPVARPLSIASDSQQRDKERNLQWTGSLNNWSAILKLMMEAGKSLNGFDQSGVLERYMDFTTRFVNSSDIDSGKQLYFGVTWLNEEGDISRTVSPDESISFQQTFEEPLARRFAYRLKRIGRYYPLYRQLGLVPESANPVTTALTLRLPRIQPPRVPTVQFLGNFQRQESQSSEWLVMEHEEEAMVQSNETLRNRLGFRGIAWTLFSEVLPGWNEWSGWKGNDIWLSHPFPEEDEVLQLSEQDLEMMKADAEWKEDELLQSKRFLGDHPFTDLLEPKGMVIRLPELPYYYIYRLATFARADDIDSKAKLTDEVRALPSRIPAVNRETSGWAQEPGSAINLWWKVPSAWESFTDVQHKLWKNEAPVAKRLWDFEIKYTVQISRQGVTIPLLHVSAEPESGATTAGSKRFIVTTAGSYLYWNKEGKVEKLNPLDLKSKFDPEIRMNLRVSEKLMRWMSVEPGFKFEIVSSRNYGHQRSAKSILVNKTPSRQ